MLHTYRAGISSGESKVREIRPVLADTPLPGLRLLGGE
jgi:hypothetical protein